jgi:hypothetical protein
MPRRLDRRAAAPGLIAAHLPVRDGTVGAFGQLRLRKPLLHPLGAQAGGDVARQFVRSLRHGQVVVAGSGSESGSAECYAMVRSQDMRNA